MYVIFCCQLNVGHFSNNLPLFRHPLPVKHLSALPSTASVTSVMALTAAFADSVADCVITSFLLFHFIVLLIGHFGMTCLWLLRPCTVIWLFKITLVAILMHLYCMMYSIYIIQYSMYAKGLRFFCHNNFESKSQGNQYCRINISKYKSHNKGGFPDNDVMDNMATYFSFTTWEV